MAGRKSLTRKEQADQTAAALKAAARRVFADRGYLATKITDITAAADRAAGSFYNHFGSKEEILAALLADIFAAGDEAVEDPSSAHSPDFTDAAAIRWHIAAYWDFAEQHADVITTLEQAALVDPGFAARLREMLAVQQQDLREHLDHVTAAGRTLPGDPTAVVSAMLAMILEFRTNWVRTDGFGGTVPREDAIDLVTTFIHRGLNG